jgi:hypothetical protein
MATTFAEKKFTGISEKVTQKLSSPITKMIRMDHSHVLVLSHKYSADASPQQKAAIVKSVCLALEIHAQLEEEIFYPAMREVESSDPVLDKSKPEHDEMRRLIADLRAMGETSVLVDRSRKPLGRRVLLRAMELYQERFAEPDGRVPATFEIVTVTGWAPHDSQQKPLRPGSAKMRLADALGTVERPAGDKAGG